MISISSSGERKSLSQTNCAFLVIGASGGRLASLAGRSISVCPMRRSAARELAGAWPSPNNATRSPPRTSKRRQRQRDQLGALGLGDLGPTRTACRPRRRTRTRRTAPLPIRARARTDAAIWPIAASRSRWRNLRDDSGGIARSFRPCRPCAVPCTPRLTAAASRSASTSSGGRLAPSASASYCRLPFRLKEGSGTAAR